MSAPTPVPPAPLPVGAVRLWRYVAPNGSDWTEVCMSPFGDMYRTYIALPLAAFDEIAAYAETGEAVEGLLCALDMDDADKNPVDVVNALAAKAARCERAEAMLDEARGCVAANYGPNELTHLLARIDAQQKGRAT